MARNYFDWFWHSLLKRPYSLHVSIERNRGGDQTVVLLHGIGTTGLIWKQVAEQLGDEPERVVAFDLLGFGRSPKPKLNYSTDDHARAVIKSMLDHKLSKPITLVGHSMGALIAVRVARLRPDLVQHLILFQMPVYEGLPNRRAYALRKDIYFRVYKAIADDPAMLLGTSLRAKVLRNAGVTVSLETLQPFARSLRHTIMEQTAISDMAHLRMPIDVVYGSLDLVVIRGKPKTIFAKVLAPLSTHTIANLHEMTPRASKFLTKRIKAASSKR